MGFNEATELANFGGGLNLQDASGVLNAADAIDALNVDFLSRGAIQQRSGYTTFTDVAGAADYDSLAAFYTSTGTAQVLAGRGTVVEALNTSGVSVASQSGQSASLHYFARYGAPGTERMYIGNGTDQIIRWDGSSFTDPASANVPKGKFLAVQPSENRLVTAGFDTSTGGPAGATTNASTVWFSDAGDPTTWGANNYVHLDPGDGYEITGLAAWQQLLFVFKESKIYVFYGNSTDSGGDPIFNYRTIPGPGPVAPRSITVAPDGVYFVARTGVYRTAGGSVELVSEKIDAIFGNSPMPNWYTGDTANQAEIAVAAGEYWNRRLYFALPTGTSSTNDRTFVYDPDSKAWTPYDFPAADLCAFRVSSSEELLFAYATGTNDIGRHSAIYTNDDGSAISSRWRGGWFRPLDGEPSLREVETWAYGRATVSAGTDFNNGTGTGVAYDFTSSSAWTWGSPSWTWGDDAWTWGDGPSISSRTLRGFGARGRYFSFSFANATLDRTMRIERIRAYFKGNRNR